MHRHGFVTLLLATVLTLSGCGFHLRTQPELGRRYQRLYLHTSAPYSDFNRALRYQLINQQVCIVERCDQAPIGLHLKKAAFHTDPSTIGNSSIARVYRYTLQVDYQLTRPDGKPIGPTQHIIANRFATLNAGILTETNNKIYLLHQGLIDDAIRQLFARLNRTAACQPPHAFSSPNVSRHNETLS